MFGPGATGRYTENIFPTAESGWMARIILLLNLLLRHGPALLLSAAFRLLALMDVSRPAKIVFAMESSATVRTRIFGGSLFLPSILTV
jgi:hypothetical protein